MGIADLAGRQCCHPRERMLRSPARSRDRPPHGAGPSRGEPTKIQPPGGRLPSSARAETAGSRREVPVSREFMPGAVPITAIRSWLREELPLSTRVHELAKELGLKSQELLERIQKWGLDVKVSALASLDPSTVERIRELNKTSPAGGRSRSGRAEASGLAGGPHHVHRQADGPAGGLGPLRPARGPRGGGPDPRRPASRRRRLGTRRSGRSGLEVRRNGSGRIALFPAPLRPRLSGGRGLPSLARRSAGPCPVTSRPRPDGRPGTAGPLGPSDLASPVPSRRRPLGESSRRRPSLGPHPSPRQRGPSRRLVGDRISTGQAPGPRIANRPA